MTDLHLYCLGVGYPGPFFKGKIHADGKSICYNTIGGSKGVYGDCTPLQISKIKESNNTKQKIEDNPLEKEEERKNCMFV